jgi:hypothetical protein
MCGGAGTRHTILLSTAPFPIRRTVWSEPTPKIPRFMPNVETHRISGQLHDPRLSLKCTLIPLILRTLENGYIVRCDESS